ncbi:Mov34/MPN/PAD-1 family protein [Bradyrhizobium sp. ARR65]|uniref:Mov34/MPN/PAD-1 family protein n=1 Tax=Bradyrhizobium sp. ARR65 TaxID=1040989 RepID=UPI000A63CC07|nr:Mov34/MPN/PAD-1 family protein [Bradyrhizobium sp. ARR65]
MSFHTLALLIEEADRRYPLETGGALIGYWGDAVTAVVTQVVGPGPASDHQPYSYQHDHLWEASQIALHYKQSGRSHVYIGDWHTHPDATFGDLSGTDRQVTRQLIKSREARTVHPLMAVLFGRPGHWDSAIWVAALKPRWGFCSRLSLEPAKLQLFDAAEGQAN